ncbi:hypothetical protein [Novosphingobium sp.]|uniref:hypothetical protein n=1 Tax=Novosphingobium sp. TaxID=1874826 RepID=UPI00261B9D1C|nr:hypothetical protein [Novosphingobium sp.]
MSLATLPSGHSAGSRGSGADTVFDDVGAAHATNVRHVPPTAHTGKQGRQVIEPMRDDMDQIAFTMQLAAAPIMTPEHRAPIPLEGLGPDHEIGDLGFILQRDEHDPFRRAGLLPDTKVLVWAIRLLFERMTAFSIDIVRSE